MDQRNFLERVNDLPYLGLGVSTEYGAFDAEGSLDVNALWDTRPEFASFLEVGVEVVKGLDGAARDWAQKGRPTTYHFLDVNLDDPDDLDAQWIESVRAISAELSPAWMCGDAGLWHFGRRDRGHMLLLPPILSDESASAMAKGITALRAKVGLEVLPENPPGHLYIGDLHLLDFFARVCERADTGMLLDVAHLALYQRCMGLSALDGLADFPLDRVIEIHIAGASLLDVGGLEVVEDDHTVEVLPETWEILEWIAPRTPNLRAVVFECERNPMPECLPGFERIWEILAGAPFGRRAAQ